MKFTPALIKQIAPKVDPTRASELSHEFNLQLPEAGITSPKAVALFLANTLAETGGWTMFSENLNYSAQRLREVWPSRFRTMTEARRYANNPEKLANYVYNRFGNEKIKGGGWKYRGRGLIQTTFHANYAALQKATGLQVLDHPDMLLQTEASVKAAIFYWNSKKLTPLAEASKIAEVRRAINGGTNGLSEVIAYYKKVLPIVADLDLKKEVAKTIGKVGGAGGGAVVTTTVATDSNPSWIIPVVVIALVAVGIAVYRIRKARKKDVELSLLVADVVLAGVPAEAERL